MIFTGVWTLSPHFQDNPYDINLQKLNAAQDTYQACVISAQQCAATRPYGLRQTKNPIRRAQQEPSKG